MLTRQRQLSWPALLPFATVCVSNSLAGGIAISPESSTNKLLQTSTFEPLPSAAPHVPCRLGTHCHRLAPERREKAASERASAVRRRLPGFVPALTAAPRDPGAFPPLQAVPSSPESRLVHAGSSAHKDIKDITRRDNLQQLAPHRALPHITCGRVAAADTSAGCSAFSHLCSVAGLDPTGVAHLRVRWVCSAAGATGDG